MSNLIPGAVKATSQTEKIVRYEAELAKLPEMRTNENKYGSPTKVLKRMREETFTGAWDMNSQQLAKEVKVQLY